MTQTNDDAETAPHYVQVTLSRAIDVEGHAYLPGVVHIVDAATRAAMGDAVATEAPVKV